MFENKETLTRQLGDEIILGMDIFDVDDIWEVIGKETEEELRRLANDVRLYIMRNYPQDAYSLEFLEKQINLWIFQNTWRKKEESLTVDSGKREVFSFCPDKDTCQFYNYWKECCVGIVGHEVPCDRK